MTTFRTTKELGLPPPLLSPAGLLLLLLDRSLLLPSAGEPDLERVNHSFKRLDLLEGEGDAGGARAVGREGEEGADGLDVAAGPAEI